MDSLVNLTNHPRRDPVHVPPICTDERPGKRGGWREWWAYTCAETRRAEREPAPPRPQRRRPRIPGEKLCAECKTAPVAKLRARYCAGCARQRRLARMLAYHYSHPHSRVPCPGVDGQPCGNTFVKQGKVSHCQHCAAILWRRKKGQQTHA